MSEVAPGWALSKAEELLRQADPRAANNGGGNVAVWILKAFASYIVEQRPADIPKELQPRVVALLRDLASGKFAIDSNAIGRARAIVAELPEPPDPLLIEARNLVAAQYTIGSKTYSKVMEGGFDNSDGLKMALAALRRGQELGRSGE